MDSVQDFPITNATEDTLDRAKLSIDIAKFISTAAAPNGLVMGICGPWGSGKTSLCKLIQEQLKVSDCPIVEFNPWFFSNVEEVTLAFLKELSEQLNLEDDRYSQIASLMNFYGNEMTELISTLHPEPRFAILAWLTRFASKIFRKPRKDIHARKSEIESGLRNVPKPIIVFIDDIDRLALRDIQDIFKLVRLVADFPNVIYVLCFDRNQVANALTASGIDGQAYLEKIIPIIIDIPSVPDQLLTNELTRHIELAIGESIKNERFDEQRWPDVLFEIIRPLIRNHRDIKRFSSTIQISLESLKTEIELVDLIALESIRIFKPSLFEKLAAARFALTDVSARNPDEMSLAEQIHSLHNDNRKDNEYVDNLISRLFPAALGRIGKSSYDSSWSRTWLKEGRVAHHELFAHYLERFESETLRGFVTARGLLNLSNAKEIRDIFGVLDPKQLDLTIAAFENFEDEYPVNLIVPLSTTILNAIPTLLLVQRNGFLSISAELTATRVVLRLLKQLTSKSKVMVAVQEILPMLETLSSQMTLVRLVGHEKNIGHGLVTLKSAKVLENDLLGQIRRAKPSDLVREWELPLLLIADTLWNSKGKPILKSFSNGQLNAVVFRQSLDQEKRQQMGNRAVSIVPKLQWNILREIYGTNTRLRIAIKSLEGQENVDGSLSMIMDLAKSHIDNPSNAPSIDSP